MKAFVSQHKRSIGGILGVVLVVLIAFSTWQLGYNSALAKLKTNPDYILQTSGFCHWAERIPDPSTDPGIIVQQGGGGGEVSLKQGQFAVVSLDAPAALGTIYENLRSSAPLFTTTEKLNGHKQAIPVFTAWFKAPVIFIIQAVQDQTFDFTTELTANGGDVNQVQAITSFKAPLDQATALQVVQSWTHEETTKGVDVGILFLPIALYYSDGAWLHNC